ncbi:MAG: SDR family NAD(P)-dependent oxidoreductase [bacterium]
MTEENQGGTVLITGATSGIGRAAAAALCRRGATVILGARSRRKGRKVRDRMLEESGGAGEVHLAAADLRDLAAVREMARGIVDRHPRLDVLVNNAGVYLPRRRTTGEGWEETFAVNHLAHFLLTLELLDLLRESAPARIINVTSGVHERADLDLDDLQMTSDYSGITAYANSKLANVLFTRELARRLQGEDVGAAAVHPGPVRSSFYRHLNPLLRLFLLPVRPLMRSNRKGAETIVWLAAEADHDELDGGYFKDRERVAPSPAARDDERARRLWEESLRLVGAVRGADREGYDEGEGV